MRAPFANMLLAAGTLAVFAIVGSSLVVFTWQATRARIADNEHAALIRDLALLIPPDRYDNDPLVDSVELRLASAGGSTLTPVYRARRGAEPVAVFATITAADGYSGAINLLVAVYYDGTLAGVRVLSHRETPGLGDRIERRRSNWIDGFEGRAIGDPPAAGWAVGADGGQFDQFSGATVTPRAVVSAVYNFLRYFGNHRQRIFEQPATTAQ